MEETLIIKLKFSLNTILRNYGLRIKVKFNHEKVNREVSIKLNLDYIR